MDRHHALHAKTWIQSDADAAMQEIAGSPTLSSWLLRVSQPPSLDIPASLNNALAVSDRMKMGGIAPEILFESILIPLQTNSGFTLGLEFAPEGTSYVALYHSRALQIDASGRLSQCARFAVDLETATLYSAWHFSEGQIFVCRSVFARAESVDQLTFVARPRWQDQSAGSLSFCPITYSSRRVSHCPECRRSGAACPCQNNSGEAAFSTNRPTPCRDWTDFETLASLALNGCRHEGVQEFRAGPSERELFACLPFKSDVSFGKSILAFPALKTRYLESVANVTNLLDLEDRLLCPKVISKGVIDFRDLLLKAEACYTTYNSYDETVLPARQLPQLGEHHQSATWYGEEASASSKNISPEKIASQERSEKRLREASVTSRVRTSKGIYACEICGSQFSQRGHANQHMLFVHRKLRPHKCNLCPLSFSVKYKLRRHISAVSLGLIWRNRSASAVQSTYI